MLLEQLQSPESFAKSVQELTIVLQRTGDPANLASLRPHLELLAAIDHNPGRCLHMPTLPPIHLLVANGVVTSSSWDACVDAPPPSWEELESVMLAVKLVVHGLVEFIQNFSKKSHDAPQVMMYLC